MVLNRVGKMSKRQKRSWWSVTRPASSVPSSRALQRGSCRIRVQHIDVVEGNLMSSREFAHGTHQHQAQSRMWSEKESGANDRKEIKPQTLSTTTRPQLTFNSERPLGIRKMTKGDPRRGDADQSRSRLPARCGLPHSQENGIILAYRGDCTMVHMIARRIAYFLKSTRCQAQRRHQSLGKGSGEGYGIIISMLTPASRDTTKRGKSYSLEMKKPYHQHRCCNCLNWITFYR